MFQCLASAETMQTIAGRDQLTTLRHRSVLLVPAARERVLLSRQGSQFLDSARKPADQFRIPLLRKPWSVSNRRLGLCRTPVSFLSAAALATLSGLWRGLSATRQLPWTHLRATPQLILRLLRPSGIFLPRVMQQLWRAPTCGASASGCSARAGSPLRYRKALAIYTRW